MRKLLHAAARQWRQTSTKRKVLTGTTIVFLAAFLALLLSVEKRAAGPQDTGDLPPPGPAIASHSDYSLSQEEIENKVDTYRALLVWGELLHRETLGDASNLIEYMNAEPSLQCTRQHRTYRNMVEIGAAEEPESWGDYLADCTKHHYAETSSADKETWFKLSEDERHARSSQAMLRIWNVISPERHLETELARNRAIEVHRDNDEEFREFAENYDECALSATGEAGRIARSQNPQQMAEILREEISRLTQCASEATARVFPVPELQTQEAQTPEAANGDTPEDDTPP